MSTTICSVDRTSLVFSSVGFIVVVGSAFGFHAERAFFLSPLAVPFGSLLCEGQSVLRSDQVLATDHSGRELAALNVVDDGSLRDSDESGEV